jgi:TPR repeat protein
MAAYEIAEVNGAVIAEGAGNADALFDLGMNYAIGRSVPLDLISAHKWFNLAAMRGNKDAIRLRREIAEQMSEAEIAAAQKAARNWLTTH